MSEYPEEAGLTDELKYGKTTSVGVNETRDESSVEGPDSMMYSEVLELPYVAHDGMCWVGFRYGDLAGCCACLRSLLEVDDDG